MRERVVEAKKQKAHLARRDFLKTATAGAGGAALAGFGASEAGAVQLSEVRKWDYEAGIVVLGTGGAGLATWNKSCAAGNDSEFGRASDRIAPIQTPPYYALELVPMFTNTQGGPRRNKNAKILDPYGKPIPRLYSAGELGSIWSWHYEGAGDFAECLAFGRIAGEHAAAEKPWS
jgi:hypothetical protein